MQKIFEGKCTDPLCDYSHPPVCKNYKSESGCTFGDQCLFGHTEAVGQPRKIEEKWPCCERLFNWVLCPKMALRERLFCGEMENWDRITRSSSGRPRCFAKKFEKERVHGKEFCKSVNLKSAIRVRQKFEERSQEETLLATTKMRPQKKRETC